MKQYISFFKLKFTVGLQYRAAAIAGFCTQLFFGLVSIMVYIAFYGSGDAVDTDITLKQLITYMWLNQAFFSLIYIWHRDNEILNMIKNGDVSYELCRPQNLYLMWYIRILSSKLSSVTLRCIPLIIIVLLLPKPYNLSLPYSINSLIIFIFVLILSSLLVTGLVALFYVLTFYTTDGKGVMSMYSSIAEILSGQIVPIPLFPKILKGIASLLPFAYISDFAFRIYCGNIVGIEIWKGIIIQMFWIVVIIFVGMKLTDKILQRVVVQGG